MHFHMLIGKAPFEADDMKQFKLRVKKGTYKYPKQHLPSVESIYLISRCLVESETQRFSYSSLAELNRRVMELVNRKNNKYNYDDDSCGAKYIEMSTKFCYTID